jgi:hypothetical protein
MHVYSSHILKIHLDEILIPYITIKIHQDFDLHTSHTFSMCTHLILIPPLELYSSILNKA